MVEMSSTPNLRAWSSAYRFSAYRSQPWEHNSPNSAGSLGLNFKLKKGPCNARVLLFTKGSQAQTTSRWTLAICSIRYNFNCERRAISRKYSFAPFKQILFAFLRFSLFTARGEGIRLINRRPFPGRVPLGRTYTVKKSKYNL